MKPKDFFVYINPLMWPILAGSILSGVFLGIGKYSAKAVKGLNEELE